MTSELQQADTNSLGRTGKEENCLLCERATERHRALSWDMKKLRVYGSGLEGKPAQPTLMVMFATSHLIMKKCVRPSSDT